MISPVVVLALLALAVSGCGLLQRTVAGSGVLVEEDLSVSPFRAIEVDDGIDVTLRRGAGHEMHLRVDDNLREFLIIEESNGLLAISIANDISLRSATLEVRITAPGIDTIHARGGAQVQLEDPIEAALVDVISSGGSSVSGPVGGGRLNVTASGNGTADLHASTDEVLTGASGSSRVVIVGSSGSVEITGSGSSETDLSGLTADTAEVALSGSAQALIGPTDQLAVDVSGSSSLRFDGDPEVTTDRRSGSATVEPLAS